MIRLGTHVVVWLYAGDVDRLSDAAKDAIESDVLAVSPMVLLELQYLHEIGRLTVGADTIIADLRERIGLGISEVVFDAVVDVAMTLPWTRDPFDRMIAADAIVGAAPLVTQDEVMRTQVPNAIW